MTTTEKILAAVMAGGVIYLLSRKALQEAKTAPERTANRVMEYSGLMLRWGAEQGIDPALTASVITVESAGDPNALGAAGEIGLMQILPSTSQWISRVAEAQLFDPSTNIRVGTAYLRYTIDRKGGNVAAGVAGYNYGPDRVQIRNGRIVVPDSVTAYVVNVLSYVDFYRERFRQDLGSFYTNIFGSGQYVLNGLPCCS